MVSLTIDGRPVEVPQGATVLDAARKLGIDIPTLCYEKDLSIAGACRLCVVELEGFKKNLPASCALPAAEGMVVFTDSPKVQEARRVLLELIIANHPLDCLTCEANGKCKLQEYCYRYGVKDSRYEGEQRRYTIDEGNPFIERDMEKCILCGKCVRVCHEVQGVGAIDFAKRGFDTKIATFFDRSLCDSPCVSCGQCIYMCPVGALTAKQSKGKGRDFEVEKVLTTCGYCGVGCQLAFNVKNDKIVGVTNVADSHNQGYLCVKGRFGYEFVDSPDRLTTPLIKKNGEFVEASWEEALDLVADKFRQIKADYGPQALAGLASARVTNEENYLFQKFFRAVIGTNNVDHCARL
jgi:predicted molibdopterin-dependent oxidoreductase YjgC